jgi:hypothetical protein
MTSSNSSSVLTKEDSDRLIAMAATEAAAKQRQNITNKKSLFLFLFSFSLPCENEERLIDV